MALDIKNAKRVFFDNKDRLEDPNINFSPDEVRKYYASQKPHLTTATTHGPQIKGEEVHYTFSSVVGTKG